MVSKFFLPTFLVFTLLVFSIGAQAQDVPLTVTGTSFSIQKLRDGGQAFGNRSYVWQNVPAQFQGWQITQVPGGITTALTVSGAKNGVVTIATADAAPPGAGWTPDATLTFSYTDPNHTVLHVYTRPYHKGMSISIPQSQWSGTLVLAPALTFGAVHPVPGVIIDYSPAASEAYIGSPSIVILPNGSYLASHDFFGDGTTNDMTRIFRSRDRGKTWKRVTDIHGQWWSTLFLHNGALYIMGVSREFGNAVIRRSTDNGATWTTPKDSQSGLLADDGHYHCAPVPVVVHDGRIWRAMEENGPVAPGCQGFKAFVWSAPENSDLLNAANWTMSQKLNYEKTWLGQGWLEGNVVVAPDGSIVDILRVGYYIVGKAAMIHISADGRDATFNPATNYINFPGGGSKFTIRYDPKSHLYWSLVDKQQNPAAERNVLALTSSPDLLHWKVNRIVLQNPDRDYTAFQYVDWQFDGPDLIAVSRTAFNGAHSYHDANYLTFLRVRNFRR